mgnify:CR=1 FL=1
MKQLIVLIGPPGSGKGTQGRLLASHFDFVYRATGDLIRAASKSALQDELYRAISARNAAGIPQPDEVVNELLWRELKNLTISHGLILDMYPLSMGQVEGLQKLVKDFSFATPHVVYFEVSEAETVRRLAMRQFCAKDNRSVMPDSEEAKTNICSVCGEHLMTREDDKPDVVKRRYQEYARRFEPMLKFFKEQGWLHIINSERGVEEIQEEVRSIVNSKSQAPNYKQIPISKFQ